MAADAAVLRAAALTVGYPGRRTTRRVVLAGLDLALPAGELTCLLGANGSGKSTLLRTLAGMQPPLAGRVTLLGDDVAGLEPRERARRLAVVLTDPVETGGMTGTDLVALGRHPHTGWSGRLGPTDHDAVDWALRATGAAPLAARPVAQLSDGERQRLLVARALAQQPAVLALDEPVAFVDLPRRVELTRLLRHLARECGLAVLLTTHDLDLALRSADTLWLLEPGPPAGLTVGAPEDLVLAGALGRAFPAEEVTFDLERGTFVATDVRAGTAAVTGTGAAATWARRALEREGLRVVVGEEPADLRVDVLPGPGWRLLGAGPPTDHATIGALVTELRGRLPELAAAPVER